MPVQERWRPRGDGMEVSPGDNPASRACRFSTPSAWNLHRAITRARWVADSCGFLNRFWFAGRPGLAGRGLPAVTREGCAMRSRIAWPAGLALLASVLLLEGAPSASAAGPGSGGPYQVKDFRVVSGPSPFAAGCPGPHDDQA